MSFLGDDMNILYIRNDSREYGRLMDSCVLKYYSFFKKVYIERLKNGIIAIIPGKEGIKDRFLEKIKKQISSIIEKEKVDYILCEEDLIQCVDELFINKILRGNTIKKYAVDKMIEKIYKIKQKATYLDNVYVLVKDYTNNEIFTIQRLTNLFKCVNIVTPNIYKYKLLESRYEKRGTLVTVSNNYRRSIKNAKIIVNIDMKREEILRYSVNQNAIVINLHEDVLLMEKSFNGIIINNIEFKQDYNEQVYLKEYFGNFNSKEIMEVEVINKNIIEIVEYLRTKEIISFIGIHGIVNDNEIKNNS